MIDVPGSETVWIGADPGGVDKFGVALLEGPTSILTVVVGCVDDAVDWVVRNVRERPAGVGVDAPLWWSSGPGGLRRADRWIRAEHRLSPSGVQAVNSMWGAVLAQGMLFVDRLRQVYPGLPVTESHPKAVLAALSEEEQRRHFGIHFLALHAQGASEDRRDALVAALCAREGFDGSWPHDLSRDRDPSEQDPDGHWFAPVRYFWPV